MIKWPEEVPLLSANHMCKGEWTKGSRHCLAEWNDRVFPDHCGQVRLFLHEVIREVDSREIITEFNDNHPVALNARVWNRAMYLLGYTVNNPEKKPLKGVK